MVLPMLIIHKTFRVPAKYFHDKLTHVYQSLECKFSACFQSLVKDMSHGRREGDTETQIQPILGTQLQFGKILVPNP